LARAQHRSILGWSDTRYPLDKMGRLA